MQFKEEKLNLDSVCFSSCMVRDLVAGSGWRQPAHFMAAGMHRVMGGSRKADKPFPVTPYDEPLSTRTQNSNTTSEVQSPVNT